MKQLHVCLASVGLPGFLHQLGMRRANRSPVTCLNLNARLDKARCGEFVQLLEYAFQSTFVDIVIDDESGDLLVCVVMAVAQARPVIAATLGQYFPDHAAKAHVAALDAKGAELIGQVVTRWGRADGAGTRAALARLQREGNVFVVLDDDPMVQRQLEQVLKGFGHVEKAGRAGDFAGIYERYYPNAAFVDVHLRDGNGITAAGQVLKTIDPNGHIVMITADGVMERVADAKASGAKGFLVKPVNRETVIRHVMTCPTFVKRQGA